MSKASASSPVRERILQTAFELFYQQGYRATGVNQIIAQAQVAKASFYDHFPTKDELLCEYVAQMSARELAELRAAVDALPTPRERYFGVLRSLKPWFRSSDYRGCPFQNVIAELGPQPTGGAPDQRVRQVVKQHREQIRAYLRDLTEGLLATEPALRKLDLEELTDLYLLLFEGAIVLAVVYRQSWPVDRAEALLAARLASA